MPVIHTSDAALAASFNPDLTVEAEYGSVVVEGSAYTAAHHQPSGPYAGDHVVAGGRPAPCNDPSIPRVAWSEGAVAVVSHLDLDTVGGLLRAHPHGDSVFRPEYAPFWSLAGFVDCNGVHKRHLAGAAQIDLDRMDAWWAWFRDGVPRLPREGFTDVTEIVVSCWEALIRILAGDTAYLAAGRRFRDAESSVNEASFVGVDTRIGIVRRVASVENAFVNHLYTAPSGEVGRAIVAHNPVNGSITVSLADPIPGVSCREIVQALWGPLAGGHAGIAGSPRGQAMTQADVESAVAALTDALIAASESR